MTTRVQAAQTTWAAISETTAAVGSIFSTVNNSVSMLNDFVKRHKDQQQVKSSVETGDYVTALVERKGREILVRREETDKYLDEDKTGKRRIRHNDILKEVNAWLPEDKRLTNLD